MDRSIVENQENTFIQTNLRRNFAALSLEMGFFGLGLTLSSNATVLSAFATRLGASNLLIGTLPALQSIGWAIPALFGANFADRKPRKLPFVLKYTTLERVPFLLIGIMALLLAETQPTAALVATLSLVAIASLSTGFVLPGWLDLVGKVIPSHIRGRFFGMSSIISGLLGMGGAAIVGLLLTDFPFPLGYAICFLSTFAAYALSYVSIAFTQEHPVQTSKPQTSISTYLRSLPGVLSADHNFSALLGARALGTASAMGLSFYTAFALKGLGAEDGQVGTFAFCMLAVQTASTPFYGWIADKYGHKLVLILGAIAIVLGSIIALRAQNPQDMYFVFAAAGAYWGSMNVSNFGILLAFGDAKDRVTYVGIANTLLSPVGLIATLAAGLVADRAGYGLVFTASALFAFLGLIVLATFVHEPRPGSEAVATSGL